MRHRWGRYVMMPELGLYSVGACDEKRYRETSKVGLMYGITERACCREWGGESFIRFIA